MKKTRESKETTIAKDSQRTAKDRDKVRKLLEKEQQQITPQALERTRKEIYLWITRHAKDRKVIREKNQLFDQNCHSAKESQPIQKLKMKCASEKK